MVPRKTGAASVHNLEAVSAKIFALALGVLLAAGSLGAQSRPPASPYYPPAGQWERRAPASVAMNAELVDSAIVFAKSMESTAPRDLLAEHWASPFGREPLPDPLGPFKSRGEMTGIILRHGYLVAEWGEPERVDLTFSITKSFLSSTVGFAWDRKLIPDLHARVKDYVKTGEFDSEHNAKITWEHLLRQTSDWEGTLWGKPDWSDRPPADVPIEQYKKRVHAEPGTTYKYNDVRVNLLAYAALMVWRRPLPEVLKQYLMDPIGASNTWVWHGYDNSWVDDRRQEDAVGVRRVAFGRRHVDQRARPGAVRAPHAPPRQMEGPPDPVGGVDRPGADPHETRADLRLHELFPEFPRCGRAATVA